MLSFGQRLKIIRKEAQLTQSELAEKLLVTVQSISKWECDNAMPDISQIVPLSSILGVSTDCLLGVGYNEKEDREKLYEDVKKINKGIEKVYSRKDNAYFDSYELYKEHIKKYPLDYEVKLLCADSITRIIYYCSGTKEEKDKLYNEAVIILKSIIRYDRDTTRLIDAKRTLIILYLYNEDFRNAEEVASGLPEIGSIRASMEIEIYSKKNDHNKCIEISNRVCNEAVHHYLWALAIRARRMSICDKAPKTDTISAWYDLITSAKNNYKMFDDISVNTKWLYSAFNNLSNDYIEISELDKAFEVIRELTDTLILDYKMCKRKGDDITANEIKNNFGFYLHSCFNADDSVILNDIRFKECETMLNNIE